MKNNKNSKYYVPASIQKFFVGVIGSLFIIHGLSLFSQTIFQYTQNTNIGVLYSLYFSSVIFPLLLFILAYLLNPRQLRLLERSFESMLIALSGVIAWALLTIIMPLGHLSTQSYAITETTILAVILLAYGLFLYWLRSTKRWQ